MNHHQARFHIGQLVHHRIFGYRGVIFNVDAEFSLEEEWYEQMAKTCPPKDAPWYHVLVDGAEHTTYVAERNLEPDTSDEPIDHPLIEQVLGEFDGGSYSQLETVH